MKHKCSFLVIALAISMVGIAQKEANVWYFGEYAGLDFNTGQPQVLNGMFISYRSCASISDSAGIFLFATNGEKIWNRNKQVMQNGDNLKGDDFAAQGVVIVQKPGSKNLYYVFTVPDFSNFMPPGLYYSVVDMDLDGGLGAVTDEKNILVSAAWDAYEKVMADRKSVV